MLIWTLVLAISMVVVVADAVIRLAEAGQGCFLGVVPCPELGDPTMTELTIGLLGCPLLWLAGIVVAFLVRTVGWRRRESGT